MALVALVWQMTSAHAAPSDEQIKADCSKIDDFAHAGDSAYQRGELAQAVDHYTAQASWSEFCQLPEPEIDTAYNNVALALIRNNEPLQARAWLALAPGDSKTTHNLALIKPTLARLRPALAATPMGRYWRYAGKGVWSTLSVKPKGDQWLITFEGYYMPFLGLYYGPNTGNFSLVDPITDGKAVFRQVADDGPACQIDMAFKDDQVELSATNGDCGFGMNVQTEGKFTRVSLY